MAKTLLPALLAASMLATPATLLAQDNGIGAPELQDFSLPGTRTTPPAVVQPAVPPPAPVTREPAPQPPAQQVEPAPVTKAPARTATPPAAAPAPVQDTQPAPAEQTAPLPAPALPNAPVADAPIETAPQAAPAPAPAMATNDDRLIWAAAGGAGVLALGLLALLFRRSRRRKAEIQEAAAFVPAPLPPPPPPAPPRPKAEVEIDFRPERLVTSDTQAAVHFELIIRNRGEAPARNLRIEARLFNASGAEARDVDAFFAAPAEANTSGMALPPGRGAQFTSAVAIPRDQIRVVEMSGRPLFIPTVAIKLIHDDEHGDPTRIVRRYLVGIEPREPTGKMGPFRMDVGPRIYRSVGQRPIQAA